MARGQRIRRIAVGEPRILIIGYGNTLRSDDGIGPRAAELLGKCCEDDRITIVACHQLTPELAPVLAEAGYLILLDAEIGGEPGHIRRRDLTPAPASKSVLSHACHRTAAVRACAADHPIYRHRRLLRPGRRLDPPCRGGSPPAAGFRSRNHRFAHTTYPLSRYCKPTGI
jgi:hydrogenase maturation protease